MPGSEIAQLKSVLRSDVYETPGGTLNEVSIREAKANARLKKVTIQHLGAQALVIFPDNGLDGAGCYSDLFNTDIAQTCNKVCDAVILCSHKGVHYRIFCELKSDNPKGVAAQFLGTECFLDYLSLILKKIHKVTTVTRHDRRVVFNTDKQACQTLEKQPVSFANYPPAEARIQFIKVHNNQVLGIGDLL